MCIMKTIFTFIFVLALFIGNALGNLEKTDNNKSIEIQTIPAPTQKPQPKSIRPQTITAYYNVEEKRVVVEFQTKQGTGLIKLNDSMGNMIEAKTVDTSIQSVFTLSLPTQPGEYTLLINTETLRGVGYFMVED